MVVVVAKKLKHDMEKHDMEKHEVHTMEVLVPMRNLGGSPN